MIARSVDRVALHNAPHVSEKLLDRLRTSIAHHSSHPEEIDDRLRELDEEWDVERVLQTNSSVASLLGLTLGLLGRRRWLLLPLVVQGFFLQHALQGWCPPLPLLRSLGFRTSQEIEQERYALKAVRGDFAPRGKASAASPDALAVRALRATAGKRAVARSGRAIAR
jgi:hypothetical protein